MNRSRYKVKPKHQNPSLFIKSSQQRPAGIADSFLKKNLSYDNHLHKRFRTSTEITPAWFSSSEMVKDQYWPLLSIKFDKLQVYRNRMSLDFKAFHQQDRSYQAVKQLKRSFVIDRTLIHKKAAILTNNIYQQQLHRSKCQPKIFVRIKQRLSVLKKINEQKHQLLRNYFLIKK